MTTKAVEFADFQASGRLMSEYEMQQNGLDPNDFAIGEFCMIYMNTVWLERRFKAANKPELHWVVQVMDDYDVFHWHENALQKLWMYYKGLGE